MQTYEETFRELNEFEGEFIFEQSKRHESVTDKEKMFRYLSKHLIFK